MSVVIQCFHDGVTHFGDDLANFLLGDFEYCRLVCESSVAEREVLLLASPEQELISEI